jgi:hypothetical protein
MQHKEALIGRERERALFDVVVARLSEADGLECAIRAMAIG